MDLFGFLNDSLIVMVVYWTAETHYRKSSLLFNCYTSYVWIIGKSKVIDSITLIIFIIAFHYLFLRQIVMFMITQNKNWKAWEAMVSVPVDEWHLLLISSRLQKTIATKTFLLWYVKHIFFYYLLVFYPIMLYITSIFKVTEYV